MLAGYPATSTFVRSDLYVYTMFLSFYDSQTEVAGGMAVRALS
jgi:hypothetical protein